MSSLFVALFASVASSFRTRAALQVEILALRHQLTVLQKNSPPRLRLQRSDRFLWVLLSRWWPGWRRSLHIVRPDTVIAWHHRAFAWYWTRKSRRRPGRPNVAAEIRNLIRTMSQANPLWGAPRIHGELLKLGIEVAQSTVAKYLFPPRKPPSQTWRTFLTNHMEQMASIDFFVVPTATFRILFVFVVLSHARRRVLHFQVTEHPSQEWTMQQIREAFPWDHACRYLLRDRDATYGGDWLAMTKGMGMEEVITAPRSPWQNPYVERLIGSIRHECLDHIIVWNERSLRRTLQSYFAYYPGSRTHLALGKDAPESRVVEKPERGRVVAIPQVGGLHHRYQRQAASLVIVRRCSAITASEYLALVLRTKADCLRAKTKFLLGYELFFALPVLRFRTPRFTPSTFPRSATPAEGDRVRTRFSVMTAAKIEGLAVRLASKAH